MFVGSWDESNGRHLRRHLDSEGRPVAALIMQTPAGWTWSTWMLTAETPREAFAEGRCDTLEDAKRQADNALIVAGYSLRNDLEGKPVEEVPEAPTLTGPEVLRLLQAQHNSVCELYRINQKLGDQFVMTAQNMSEELQNLAQAVRGKISVEPPEVEESETCPCDCDEDSDESSPWVDDPDVYKHAIWAEVLSNYAPVVANVVETLAHATLEARRMANEHELAILEKVGPDKFLDWEKTRVVNAAEIIRETFKPFLEPIAELAGAATKSYLEDEDADDPDDEDDEDDPSYTLSVVVPEAADARRLNEVLAQHELEPITWTEGRTVYDVGDFHEEDSDDLDDLATELLALGFRLGLARWWGGGEDVE